MLFMLKKIASPLILPPTSLILLAFVGLWLSRRHPRAGKTLIALALTTLLILSLPITGNSLIRSLETNPPITEAQLKDIQAIVILGGGKSNNAPEYGGIDTVSKWTLGRLRYGARLQQQNLTRQPSLEHTTGCAVIRTTRIKGLPRTHRVCSGRYRTVSSMASKGQRT